MLSVNHVAFDARVRKTARSVADAGWDVTVVGQSSSGSREESTIGGARLIEVPVKSAGQDWRARHVPHFESIDALLDDWQPDVVHAHAVQTLGVAVAAKVRAEQRGRDLKVVYDAHEDVDGIDRPEPTWRLAMLIEEDRHIGSVDGVVTVSDPLAELIAERYNLAEQPTVVLNAPSPARSPRPAAREGVRSACGLGPDDPLLVYSGAVAPARGVHTVVAALPALPNVHFALQVAERHEYVVALEEQADSLDVADRVHVLPYVAAEDVVAYVRSATAGVIPLLHSPNHEVALTNKYLEFMHARLPILTSDVKLQAELTRASGNGEVFRADDVAAFLDAVRAVLAAPARYSAVYENPGLLEDHSWEAQVPALLGLYDRLSATVPRR